MKSGKWTTAFASALIALAAIAHAQANKTKNVVIVMTDGLRWQEVFRGADASLFPDTKDANAEDKKLRQQFSPGTPEQNRTALMPFFWNTIAKQGQIFGDRDAQSSVVVTNGFKFSYPGYSETLTGRPNPAIDSNDAPNNPHASVLEWLNNQAEFKGKVAAFAMWDRFAQILRRSESGLPVNVAYEPLILSPMPQGLSDLNAVKTSLPRIFGDDESYDAPEFYQALVYLHQKKPRVLFISLGETDDWAHRRNYPQYLASAHRFDSYLQTLWNTLQSMPEYRNSTTLVLTTDHGRGSGKEWSSHGQKIDGAENIWTAYLGPDTRALGQRANVPQLTQGQLAATVAALLGKNFGATDPSITPSITDVLAH
ncbi:alkaline phosphatase family protein [Edaphobacter albus]|uniref:alkaline phosphatase family protein n=1 Tax=Edaphobacter sp. 4G125 TaxID=2763071 RepID=UPI0016456DD9|nr:alkaline phosphatase family protein [Edaphobacter sp. 4G125]QNI36486.1 alkaline phosphatase family protein [Edaphobacter sp. 4G125]